MHSNYNLLLSILVIYTRDRSHPKGKPVLGTPPKIHTYIASYIYIATEKTQNTRIQTHNQSIIRLVVPYLSVICTCIHRVALKAIHCHYYKSCMDLTYCTSYEINKFRQAKVSWLTYTVPFLG